LPPRAAAADCNPVRITVETAQAATAWSGTAVVSPEAVVAWSWTAVAWSLEAVVSAETAVVLPEMVTPYMVRKRTITTA